MDIINSIGNMLNAVSNNTFFGKIAIAAGSVAAAYFTPIVGLLFACFTCTVVDLIYGMKVARMQGKKLTSRKNWKGTLKKLRDEFTMIMLGHVIEFNVMGEQSMTIISGGTTALICLTELWSILENLNTLNPDGPWKILGSFLKKKGEDFTGIEIELDKDGKLNGIKSVDSEELAD